MNKEILEKCVVLIGLDGKAKDQISKSLAEKLGYKEVDLRLLEFCPYTTERIEVEIELAKRQLKELKTKLKFAIKPTRKEKIKNQIEQTKQYILDMHSSIPLREMFYYVSSFPYIGYDHKLANHIRENFDEKTYNVYLKNFENKLIKIISHATKEPYVIKMPASASNVLQSEEEVYYESENKKLSYWLHKNDKQKVVKDMEDAYSGYKNIVYLKQTPDKNASQIEREYLEDGQFESLANKTIDIDGVLENGIINQEKLDEVTNQIIGTLQFDITKCNADCDSEKIEKVV